PWPKSMRWGSGSLRWVRPLQSILCILSDEHGVQVVPLVVDGIVAGDSTQGHRFMSPDRFFVTGFEDYAAKLKRAHVILPPDERSGRIWADATNLAFASGFEMVEDGALLAEVAGLVEWPVALMGEIGAEFLDLPPEVLQTSMREHQKFFSVKNPATGRIERFVTVANRETEDAGATILAGNRKVLSARLADARFFWENDLRVAKNGMKAWAQSLENVTFHNKLGSQGARIRRIAALARDLAPVTGADADRAETAARLAKLDLASEMVYEFPELQGLMGRYYITAAGHDDAIAAAAQDHYAPLGPSDAVPGAPVSVTVALADKIDTLAGFWAIDEKPTGSKDPFALRRAALGVIRLVLENGLRLKLAEVVEAAMGRAIFDREMVEARQDDQPFKAENLIRGFPDHSMIGIEPEKETDLLAFLHDRLKVHLREQGIRHDIIDACIAMPNNDDLTLLVKRARALNDVLDTEDGENLLQGFKRANNILTQAEEKDGVEYSFGADAKFAETASETALFAALTTAEARIAPALAAEDFPEAMAAMAGLRGPIDAFFEDVQVNTENTVLRRNRLNLLHDIRRVCTGVADLTRIEG
ncbi:MAG: glycine--tRNA ligase subunit beta, partial [Rhodobacteraceae bacterium]|nr:glycine--tRNA ligase subunit beta [Paracoccaceae bacterium]